MVTTVGVEVDVRIGGKGNEFGEGNVVGEWVKIGTQYELNSISLLNLELIRCRHTLRFTHFIIMSIYTNHKTFRRHD